MSMQRTFGAILFFSFISATFLGCGDDVGSAGLPDASTDGSMADPDGGPDGPIGQPDGGPDGGEIDAAAIDADVDPGLMTFFVTSEGNGTSGGNLGGLDGADARCQTLAQNAGAGDRTWHAYLSTANLGIGPVVDARDRIGTGPWLNAAGEMVAADVQSLHADGIPPERMLDEQGNSVPEAEEGLLTGSRADGTVQVVVDVDRIISATCRNWTSSDSSARGWLGNAGGAAGNWNDDQITECNPENMAIRSGTGRLMCFAID
jgi:hypothetical protein